MNALLKAATVIAMGAFPVGAGHSTSVMAAQQGRRCLIDPGNPFLNQYVRNRSSTDANGCRSPVHEPLHLPVPESFYQGPGFRPGVFAYEYFTKETTISTGGRDLIQVRNPTHLWLEAYAGHDACTTPADSASSVCTTSPPQLVPDDWWAVWISLVVVLVVVLGVLYTLRSGGSYRHKRRHRRGQRRLRRAFDTLARRQPAREDVALARSLGRLEKATAPSLSQAQRVWFAAHMRAGQITLAAEFLARWLIESGRPITPETRHEMERIATALGIDAVVMPILGRRTSRCDRPVEGASPNVPTGYLMGLDRFRELVTDAIDTLPQELQTVMENVATEVEDGDVDGEVFGTYRGVSRRSWRPSISSFTRSPDKVILFRQTICAHCRSEAQVTDEIRRTLHHEVAHHFGISDARLGQLGLL